MKTLMLLMLVALCGIAWRSPDIMETLGRAKADPPAVPIAAPAPAHRPMSLHEYAELSRTDPEAHRKLLESMQVPQERGELDKLMNLFARGKYE